MTDQNRTTDYPTWIMCPDRQHVCTRNTCLALGCQSPFSHIERLADNVAIAVLGPSRGDIREALVEFANALKEDQHGATGCHQ